MPDSPLFNVGRPRKSFLDDEYTGDDRLAGWAEETGRIKPVEREGSTFYEDVDPVTGGKRYYARKNSVGRPNPDAQIMQDERGNEMITADKTYKKPLTNMRAMSFKSDFDTDMQKRELEAERARRKAEQLDAETRAREGRVNEAREMKKLDREFQSPAEAAQASMVKLQMGQLENQFADRNAERTRAETRRVRDEGRESTLRQGKDIPGISESGEKAAAAALASGADLQTAEQLGRRAHDADISQIAELERSGDPTKIAQAARLRQDPDLKGVRSFIPERDVKAEADLAIGEVDPYFAALDKAAKEEDMSWDFWNQDGTDPYADIDPEVRNRLNVQLSDAVRNIQRMAPRMSTQEVQDIVLKRARERGLPGDFLIAIRSLVQ